MEISSKSSLDGCDGLAIGLATHHGVGHVTVAPALAAVLEARNESSLHTWLGECYTGREKLVRLSIRGVLYSRRIAHI